MGQARAKAAGEMGRDCIRFGRKAGVSAGKGAAPRGRADPEDDGGKGASKGVEATVEGARNGEGWLEVARGHCWGAREQGGGRVGPGCPKAAVTLKAEDAGSTTGEEKQKMGKDGKGRKKQRLSYAAQLGTTCLTRNTGIFNLRMKVTTQD